MNIDFENYLNCFDTREFKCSLPVMGRILSVLHLESIVSAFVLLVRRIHFWATHQLHYPSNNYLAEKLTNAVVTIEDSSQELLDLARKIDLAFQKTQSSKEPVSRENQGRINTFINDIVARRKAAARERIAQGSSLKEIQDKYPELAFEDFLSFMPSVTHLNLKECSFSPDQMKQLIERAKDSAIELDVSGTSIEIFSTPSTCRKLTCAGCHMIKDIGKVPDDCKIFGMDCDHLINNLVVPMTKQGQTYESIIQRFPDLDVHNPIFVKVLMENAIVISAFGAKLDKIKTLYPNLQLNHFKEIAATLTHISMDSTQFNIEETEEIIKAAANTVIVLDVDHNQKISHIPNLKQCQKLKCSDTPIKTIGDLASCKQLIACLCKNLQVIGDISECEDVFLLRSSPSLKFTKVGPETRVYRVSFKVITPDLGRSFIVDGELYADLKRIINMTVDVENMDVSNFREVVCQLKTYSLHKIMNDVRISYYGSEGVDHGGLKRDLITQIFKVWRLQSPENDILPLCVDPRDIAFYQTIGRLFALCMIDDNFKLGRVFESKLFELLSIDHLDSLDFERLDLDPQSLESWIRAVLCLRMTDGHMANKMFQIAMYGFTDETDLSDPKLRDSLAAMMNSSDEDFDFEKHTKEECTNKLQEAFVSLWHYSDDALKAKIYAASLIASELKKELGEAEWEQEIAQAKIDPNYLIDKIEGKLDKNYLMERIKWPNDFPPEKANDLSRAQEYFGRWLETASLDYIRDFVRATTGNETLGYTTAIEMKFGYREASRRFHFMASTCTFEIWINDFDLAMTFEQFEEKFKEFLVNALALSGFTRN